MAEFEAPAVAPPWSKFAGVPLADLSSDDLRDLSAGARRLLPAGPRARVALPRSPPGRTPSAPPPRVRLTRFPAGFHSPFTAGAAVVVLIPATAISSQQLPSRHPPSPSNQPRQDRTRPDIPLFPPLKPLMSFTGPMVSDSREFEHSDTLNLCRASIRSNRSFKNGCAPWYVRWREPELLPIRLPYWPASSL